MSDSIRGFLNDLPSEVKGRLREGSDARLDEAFRAGYGDAAGACLGVLAKNINELQSELGDLPKDEQVALSRLLALERSIKKELGSPWSTRS